jgi:hypothetical protein
MTRMPDFDVDCQWPLLMIFGYIRTAASGAIEPT